MSLAALRSLHPKLASPEDRPKHLALDPDSARLDAALPLARDGLVRDGLVSLDQALPDGGLPRGAVVELSSSRMLGAVTAVALRACAAAQGEARLRSGDPRTEGAFCGFVDPWSTLHAPAVVEAGVDPTRLLVVRPPLDALARVVVRMAEARVFSVLVVDTACVPGAEGTQAGASSVRLDRWPTVVRRVALAIEATDTTVILLSDRCAPRALPLPVAMRLEFERHRASESRLGSGEAELWLKVAKERYGRVRGSVAVALG